MTFFSILLLFSRHSQKVEAYKAEAPHHMSDCFTSHFFVVLKFIILISWPQKHYMFFVTVFDGL